MHPCNDLALLAEDRLIGERIGEGESEAVIILKGTKHFVRINDFDPGAGVIAGDAIRRGADAVTGGGFTRGIQRIGDRAGTAVGSAYQRMVDARSAAKRNDALDSEALNAYNKTWHQFAPEHSFENFQRFRQQYLRNKAIRMATRTREAN